MTVLFILCGLLLIGLGFTIWKLWSMNCKLTIERKGNIKMTNDLEEIQSSQPLVEELLKKVSYYETLCDFRVGLWSENLSVPGYSNTRKFDIEVLIIDRCEDKSKIKIIEVINVNRVNDFERKIKNLWDGQWIETSKIKELANSKILTREKRMSRLLDK